MNREHILDIVRRLRTDDKIIINNWKEPFTVCGKSVHYVLAWDGGDEYTIIKRDPIDFGPYNGITKGAIVCAADSWVFGYKDGYHFDDPAWVRRYLHDLETGETEMSMRHREEINKITLWPANGREGDT